MTTAAMHRETWLNELAKLMAPRFEQLGYPLPKFRVSIGFTSRGVSGNANGECWDKRTTPDEHFTILISPAEATSISIAAILNHELIHAAVGLKEGHKGKFAEMMKATGMQRPFTCSKPGDAFKAWVNPLIETLGDIPHAPLTVRQEHTRAKLVKRNGGGVDLDEQGMQPENNRPKKQTTRLKKAECSQCGYTVRVTNKWVVEVGPPHCPKHGAMDVDVDLPDDEQDDEE